MLPRAHRIPRARFPRSLRGGVRGTYASVSSTPAPAFGAAVVVSKKVAKSAVARNLLRRRTYAILSGIHHRSPHWSGHIVVVLSPAAPNAPFDLLKTDIERAAQALLEKRPRPR